jgi:hypothetical protein
MRMQRGLALQPVGEQLPVPGHIRSPGPASLNQLEPVGSFATVDLIDDRVLGGL